MPGPSISVVGATLEYAERMAPTMREADAAEVLASSNETPIEALERSIAASSIARCLLIDGEPAAIWGVAPVSLIGGIAVCWMLSGTRLNRVPIRMFLKLCRSELSLLRRSSPTLFNFIDDRYSSSIRWAKWLGFSADEPEPYGDNGMMFRRVVIGR